MLAAAGGVTFSRLRNGVQLHRFDSALPGGSSATAGRGGNAGNTILDCVYQPETMTHTTSWTSWPGRSVDDAVA